MATLTESAANAVMKYAEPVRTAVGEKTRSARRALIAGRDAVEDVAADATRQVRRHPFVSLGIAAGIGALFGCVIGFAAGRCGGARPSE